MLADGLFDRPPLFQIVLGTSWGLPATPETLIYMRNLLPPGAIWAAFGIARMQMPIVAQSVLLGGNVRVGLEDNLYVAPGQLAQSNGELVAKAAELVRLVGGEVASVHEAREMLALPLR